MREAGAPELLPANPDAIDVSARLLWQFGLLAAGTSPLLWATLTVVSGVLTAREQPHPAAAQDTRKLVPAA